MTYPASAEDRETPDDLIVIASNLINEFHLTSMGFANDRHNKKKEDCFKKHKSVLGAITECAIKKGFIPFAFPGSNVFENWDMALSELGLPPTFEGVLSYLKIDDEKGKNSRSQKFQIKPLANEQADLSFKWKAAVQMARFIDVLLENDPAQFEHYLLGSHARFPEINVFSSHKRPQIIDNYECYRRGIKIIRKFNDVGLKNWDREVKELSEIAKEGYDDNAAASSALKLLSTKEFWRSLHINDDPFLKEKAAQAINAFADHPELQRKIWSAVVLGLVNTSAMKDFFVAIPEKAMADWQIQEWSMLLPLMFSRGDARFAVPEHAYKEVWAELNDYLLKRQSQGQKTWDSIGAKMWESALKEGDDQEWEAAMALFPINEQSQEENGLLAIISRFGNGGTSYEDNQKLRQIDKKVFHRIKSLINPVSAVAVIKGLSSSSFFLGVDYLIALSGNQGSDWGNDVLDLVDKRAKEKKVDIEILSPIAFPNLKRWWEEAKLRALIKNHQPIRVDDPRYHDSQKSQQRQQRSIRKT